MPALCILVAEDNPVDRLILATLLERQGHRVLTAGDGAQAVARFAESRPHLVLMDMLMPVMDGLEAARAIKRLAGEQLVPIIFLTAMTESEALIGCLEAGGDDFLAKPYNPFVLEAKILAMNRLRLLQATVLEQRDLIARQHERLVVEQAQARRIFDRVAYSDCLQRPGIRYRQSPLALFNGDLLLAARAPGGSLVVLLGDFTGHGLPAAVGAMPLAETFHGMVAKGYDCAQLLRELNAKLVRILPVEMFCCAMLLDLDPQRGLARVWNGGLPDGYLLRADGSRAVLDSRHPPLGIRAERAFDDRFDILPLGPQDRLLLMSDGVPEGCNGLGERFGQARVEALLDERPATGPFEALCEALDAFLGLAVDDLTLVEIDLARLALADPDGLTPAAMREAGPLDWRASLALRGDTLKGFNPLPLLLQPLLQVSALREQVGAIHAVLAELYSNALEHGVLGLDSSLKRDAQGFADYYAQRASRLAVLQEGWVCVDLEFLPEGEGGRLLVTVSDSGGGFDPAAPVPGGPTALSGRGLRLARELAADLRRAADGNGVTAEFRWTNGGAASA